MVRPTAFQLIVWFISMIQHNCTPPHRLIRTLFALRQLVQYCAKKRAEFHFAAIKQSSSRVTTTITIEMLLHLSNWKGYYTRQIEHFRRTIDFTGERWSQTRNELEARFVQHEYWIFQLGRLNDGKIDEFQTWNRFQRHLNGFMNEKIWFIIEIANSFSEEFK